MRIVVIGTGYVGLVQAACLASLGHSVFGVDQDANRIEQLERGNVPFFEPGLEDLVRKEQETGNLQFTTRLSDAFASNPDAVFICVGTPSSNNGEADLSAVKAVAKEVARVATEPVLLVEKSTVPVGTGQKILAWTKGAAISVASNPEFLREGKAVEDFMHPHRLVFGVESAKDEDLLRKVYAKVEAPVLVMSRESAELSKYAANTMLAMRLSLMNEIANIADATGAHIQDVEAVVGSDPRIGAQFLRTGAGFGGSCFPKDVLALEHAARAHGYAPRLIAPIIDVNNDQPGRFVQKVIDRLGEIKGKKMGVWGLAFNKGTDDVRESPALAIVKKLIEGGADVHVFDPQAMETARGELQESVRYAASMMDAASGAEALFVLTEWDEFTQASWGQVKDLLEHSVVFDGKNFLPHADMRSAGIEVIGIGLCDDRRS